MWSTETQPDNTGIERTRLVPRQVIYYFDGPVLFTARVGLADVLCLKFDEGTGTEYYLVSEATQEKIEALERGYLSVRGSIESQNYWILETSSNLVVQRVWRVAENEFPQSSMPERYNPVFHKTVPVPDTVDQANAFFSVRFRGHSLGRDQISFRRFQSLLAEVYEVANRYLLPAPGGGVSKSSILDFDIAEPRLASVLVAITRPRVLEQSTKRRRINEIRPDVLLGEITRQRDNLMDGMEEVIKEADRRELTDQFVGEHTTWISALNTISHSGNDEVSVVEVTSRAVREARLLLIESQVGIRIKNAHRELTRLPVTLRGTVYELNAGAGTFLFRANDVRQTTCVMIPDLFDAAVAAGDLHVGGNVLVRGQFERRERRDRIVATEVNFL